jgi:mutator protein MutT
MMRRTEGVVAVIEEAGRLLAIRRAEGILAAGCWCFPGGAIEPGESIEDALIREVREEVGLTIVPQQELWQWTRPDGALHLYWWLARLSAGANELSLAEAEVAEARWLTPAEFSGLQPLLESNRAFLQHRYAAGTPAATSP